MPDDPREISIAGDGPPTAETYALADGQKLNVRVLTTLESLEELRPAWEELLSQYPQSSIFSAWEWLAPWWRAFGADQQLHVLAFEDLSSRLVGLAPLSISVHADLGKKWKALRLMGDGSGDSDNLDVPVVPGCADRVALQLLRYLEHQSSLWDFCEFNTLPAESWVANRLMSLLEEKGWSYSTGQTPRCSVSLPGDWEAYLAELSSKVRKNYKYYHRKFEKQPATRIYRCSSDADWLARLEELFELHQKRWQSEGQPGSFSSLTRRGFYQDLSAVLLQRNWLEFWLLEIDGKTVATDYGFRYGDTAYALQAGFDLAHGLDSPGFYLKGRMLKALIESGVRRYDFLGGFTESKARWNAQPSYYRHIHFALPGSRGTFYLAIRRDLRKGKEWLRRHLPETAWKFLHGFKARIRAHST
jgi:CelD/BcsL family acetyltransferase involved in cellulose biosynthesis